jgi:hypothetical protein
LDDVIENVKTDLISALHGAKRRPLRKVACECGVGTGTAQRLRPGMKGPFDDVAA